MDTNMLSLLKNIRKIGITQIQKEISKGINTYNEALDNLIHDFTIRIASKEAKDIFVNFDFDNPIKGLLGINKKQTASSDMETYLRVYPNTLKRGDYVQFKHNEWDSLNNIYLITSDIEREDVNDKLVFLKCNADLKWEGLIGTEHEEYGFPCVQSNDSYGSKTLLTNNFLSYQDTKIKILVQANEYTTNIQKNWRFVFGASDTDVFEIIDITRSIDEGIITLIGKKVEPRIEDNIQGNIAFNDRDTRLEKDKENAAYAYHLEGADVIPVGEDCEYHLINKDGNMVNMAGLIISVSNPSLVSTAQTMSSLFLSCNEGGEIVTVTIAQGNTELCRKNIYLGEDW